MQCRATSKQSGERCKRSAVTGKEVCAIHGGKSPSGIASGTYKTGRYSKSLPARLGERYEQAVRDNELIVLRDEIALIDARISDVLQRVDTGEAGAIWRSLHESFQAFTRAHTSGDVQAMSEALASHKALIRRGVSDYAAWAEIINLIERRRRLSETEQKRLITMQSMMTAEQAMTLLGVVVDTVKRHVSDPSALAGISADINQLVAGRVVNEREDTM